MQRPSAGQFDEATLLAYVEQTMPPQQRAEFEAELASDTRLLASLRLMQADCQGLRSLPEEQPPESLVADVLAGVERSMLIETDLIAPPVDMRRYRASHWQRYAAAAGFVLLLSGGGFMLFNTLQFNSRDNDFAPGPLVMDDPDELPIPAESTTAPGGSTDGEELLAAAPDAQADSHAIESSAAEFEQALAAAAEPAVIAAMARDWPTDIDLAADVVTADPSAALETLASRLRERGGDLIVNATLNIPGSFGSGRGPDQFAGRDPAAPTGVGPAGNILVPLPPSAGVVAVPDDRVPIEEQSQYAARGYQFTLLGTPSDILNVLRELGTDRSLRISWSRRGAGRLLVDLVAPNLPGETQWDHVMFWWLDPANRFDEARAAVARSATEPYIRIPVRLIASERR